MKHSFLGSILMLLATTVPVRAQQAHEVVESEPNDTMANANRASLGDILTGSITSLSDVDFFVVDIPAGTFVRMAGAMEFCIFDQDGKTLLTCNSGEYWTSGYPFTTSGRYYIRLRHGYPHVGVTPMGPYQMEVHAESFPLAAGDSARRIADLPPLVLPGGLYPNYEIWRMAAGLNGELYVTMVDGVVRIGPQGDTVTLAPGFRPVGSLTVDAFGDVIFPTWGALWRISPSGERTPFQGEVVIGQFDVPTLAMSPDGDLWIGTNAGLVRLGPTGAKKAEIPLKAPYSMVAGPAGELYVGGASGTCESGIAVVRGTDVECMLPNLTPMIADPELELAIDKDGALYVGRGDEYDVGQSDPLDSVWGHVDVFPAGSKTSRPHAHVPGLRALTFGRDTNGNITSRLFAIEIGVPSRVVELSGADHRPVGAAFNVRFFHAVLDSIPTARRDEAYHQSLHITADATPLIWTVETGTLPSGLTLSADGLLQGEPTETGTFTFTVRATSGLRSWFAPGTIQVVPAAPPVVVSVTQVIDALLGANTLSPAQAEFVDQQGNRNGILDVGDLRAYLRSQGRLP